MTNTEIKILKTLWKNEKSMTAAEILKQNPDMKEITVRKTLKSMLNDDLLKVDGMAPTTKNFARTFVPVITKEQFALNEISKVSEIDSFQFASTLLKEENLSDNQLCKLRSIIDKRLDK